MRRLTTTDPVKARTRQMHETLKRRAKGAEVSSLDEMRAQFDFFMRRGGQCPYCRTRVTHVTVSLDHMIPVNRGGGHSWINLCFCCQSCNKQKGNLTDREFEGLLRHLDAWEVECKNFTLKTGVLTAMKVGNSFRLGAQRRAKG